MHFMLGMLPQSLFFEGSPLSACGLIKSRYHEQMSLQAYSLNTPKDGALTIEIPKNATYDVVVEKLKLGLFEGGISQAYNDVKIFKVLLYSGVSCSRSNLAPFVIEHGIS